MKRKEIKMEQYIGMKIVEAEPAYRCKDVRDKVVITTNPAEAFPNYPSVEVGYRVRYQDGYESWSPKDVFEEAYRSTDGMTFGLAIEAAKRGHKITRRGWNGKNQHVELAVCISYTNQDGNVVNAEHKDIGNKALSFVGTSGVQMGWLASQADMLADDWMIVE